MSFYYKYKFTSPEPLFALVKEELKSFYDTGAIDSTLFPTYVDKCLKKLGKSSYPINQELMRVEDFTSRLPDDFNSVREAWSCTDFTTTYQLPSAVYTQVKQINTRLDSNPDLYCNLCNECEFPDVIQAIYKTTNTVAFEVRRTHLLTPGNSYPSCPKDLYCANFNASSSDSYDVRDNKFVTNFRCGNVYLQYYSNQFDEDNQLIPDDYRVMEFIEAFLKQKSFEQLKNQATDDATYRRMLIEYEKYKAMSDEAYILANTENMKEDVYRKQRAIKRIQRRFRMYDIR